MKNDTIIELLLEQGSSLSENEKTKAKGSFDPIYLDERISQHKRKGRLQSWFYFILFAVAILSTMALLASSLFSPETMLVVKGVVIGLFVALIILLPNAFSDYKKNQLLIKLVKEIQLLEKDSTTKENASKVE
ncbi:MAG TPA: hypothetical protein PL017_09370 [Tenuifilaceae bacterium]|nr:hypothetical protein [Tenuifilaceae bacterium]HPE18818.1 hypothetical protein [Tenuifilaceae bacterium]HPJ46296.1 hypothetical protein [Tenuifilaceae bacterium]HPQ34670.1 hypothetical protein [Tenuifilaceae bacterium]HRX68082.1 hypothetical protein [Tenuifilaceae bacterium]